MSDNLDQQIERRDAEEDLRDVQRRIALGMDVQAMLRGPVGKYLTARANLLLDEALTALGHVNPEDPQAIRALQMKFQLGHAFMDWLDEAVHDGKQAEAAFIAMDNQD